MIKVSRFKRRCERRTKEYFEGMGRRMRGNLKEMSCLYVVWYEREGGSYQRLSLDDVWESIDKGAGKAQRFGGENIVRPTEKGLGRAYF